MTRSRRSCGSAPPLRRPFSDRNALWSGASKRRLTIKTHLQCPCGELIEGENEDDLVEKVYEHLKEKHPQLADHYSRDDILFMAY